MLTRLNKNSKNKKKVVLITPTQIDIGLRTIAAQIEKDYSCYYLNTSKIDVLVAESYIFNEILFFLSNADFVLFSVVDYRFENVRVLADAIRAKFEIPILIGGVHAMLYPDDCINHCDAVCIGEADNQIKVLLDNWEDRLKYEIPNFWYKMDTKIIKTERENLITNLNNLPTPDFGFQNYYIAENDGIIQINNIKSHEYKHHQIGHFSTLVYSSDRGCPNSCSYCYNSNLKKIFGTKNYYRKKSIEKIIEELKIITGNTQNKYLFVNIMNDNMASRTEQELELFARLYSKKIAIPFYCMVSPMELTKNKLNSLVKAGCVELNIGIQTNEKTNIELYNRKQTNSNIYSVSELVSRYSNDIYVFYDFIINNPAENQNSLLETIELIRNLKTPCDIVSHHLCLGKDTVLYNQLLEKGIISNENSRINNSDFHDFDKYILNYMERESFFENILIEWLTGPHNHIYQGKLLRNFNDFISSTSIIEWMSGQPELQRLIDYSKTGETIDFFINNIDFFRVESKLVAKLNKRLPKVAYSNFVRNKKIFEYHME